MEMIQLFKKKNSLKNFFSNKILFLKNMNEVDSEYLQSYDKSNEMKHKVIILS